MRLIYFPFCTSNQCSRLALWLISCLSADLEITVQMLVQVDKLVQLIESPVFTCKSTLLSSIFWLTIRQTFDCNCWILSVIRTFSSVSMGFWCSCLKALPLFPFEIDWTLSTQQDSYILHPSREFVAPVFEAGRWSNLQICGPSFNAIQTRSWWHQMAGTSSTFQVRAKQTWKIPETSTRCRYHTVLWIFCTTGENSWSFSWSRPSPFVCPNASSYSPESHWRRRANISFCCRTPTECVITLKS